MSLQKVQEKHACCTLVTSLRLPMYSSVKIVCRRACHFLPPRRWVQRRCTRRRSCRHPFFLMGSSSRQSLLLVLLYSTALEKQHQWAEQGKKGGDEGKSRDEVLMRFDTAWRQSQATNSTSHFLPKATAPFAKVDVDVQAWMDQISGLQRLQQQIKSVAIWNILSELPLHTHGFASYLNI